MQDPNQSNDINIRAARFLLARTVTTCGQCHALTPVVALAVPPGHSALELDDAVDDESPAVDSWRIAAEPAFLFYVEFLPVPVQNRLTPFAPFFRRDSGGDGGGEEDPGQRRDVEVGEEAGGGVGHGEGASGEVGGVGDEGEVAHWCNHCEFCGAVFDDQELFCEPGGAFLPTSESAAGLIDLLPIELAFEAVAGGYAHEPSFFSARFKEPG